MVVAASVGGLLLMGFVPFAPDAGVLTIVVAFGLAVVTATKGTYILAVLSMVLPPAGARGEHARAAARQRDDPPASR